MSPKIFSYLGVVPFVLLMLASFTTSTQNSTIALNVFFSGLSSISLAFLAGAHWGQAVPTNNFKQYKVAIFFIIGIFASFAATFFMIKSSIPMILYAGLFWLMYYLDKQYLSPKDVPPEYFQHRYRLTIVVSVCLIITALT